MKKCSKCKELKTLDEFYNKKTTFDGKQTYCKCCQLQTSSKWQNDNKEKARESSYKWDSRNSDKRLKMSKRYYHNNKEYYRKMTKNWRDKNPEANALKCSKYRAKKLNAIHPDHNPNIEKEMRRTVHKMNKNSEVKYVLDHILPLSEGGYHHHQNLQILPKTLNLEKRDSLKWKNDKYIHWTDLPSFLIPDQLKYNSTTK